MHWKDKNFTINKQIFARENPLFIGEYHQAFKSSNFLADFGYTEGYKNTSKTKKAGSKSHFSLSLLRILREKSNQKIL